MSYQHRTPTPYLSRLEHELVTAAFVVGALLDYLRLELRKRCGR